MSRLSICDPPELRRPPPPPGPILHRRRRRPLHPYTIQDLLRSQAALREVRVGPTPFGWLIVLYRSDGRRLVRETSPLATYRQAKDMIEAEMRTGAYDKAWLVRRQEP